MGGAQDALIQAPLGLPMYWEETLGGSQDLDGPALWCPASSLDRQGADSQQGERLIPGLQLPSVPGLRAQCS